jgi:hypothetical protein
MLLDTLQERLTKHRVYEVESDERCTERQETPMDVSSSLMASRESPKRAVQLGRCAFDNRPIPSESVLGFNAA